MTTELLCGPKEHGTLFRGPMVRAILSGIKRQTRRIVSDHNSVGGSLPFRKLDISKAFPSESAGGTGILKAPPLKDDDTLHRIWPRTDKGDTIWVRETWAHWQPSNAAVRKTIFRATAKAPGAVKWKPGIHLRRAEARILLEVTSVRVERLQQITTPDAIEEGLTALSKDAAFMESQGREPTIKYGIPDRDGLPGTDDEGWAWEHWSTSPITAYRRLWEQINGVGSWDANPWVWVYEWKPLKCHACGLKPPAAGRCADPDCPRG